MDAARRFPLFARFVARIGPQAVGPENLVNAYIPVHIAEAVERGEFVDAPVRIVLDIVVAVGVMIVARIAAGDADDAYVNAMLLALARALGFDLARAEALLSAPLAPLDLDADSLLVRSQTRFRKQKRR